MGLMKLYEVENSLFMSLGRKSLTEAKGRLALPKQNLNKRS